MTGQLRPQHGTYLICLSLCFSLLKVSVPEQTELGLHSKVYLAYF